MTDLLPISHPACSTILLDFWAIELLLAKHDDSAGREQFESVHADAPAFLWPGRNSRFIGPVAGLGEER